MGVVDELRDPWGLVAGGVSGGMAWALVGGPVGVALGVGVGAAVLGVKAVTGLLVERRPARPAPQLPRPPRGSAAAGWLARAEQAVRSLDELAVSGAPGPTGQAVRNAAAEAGDTLADLARVAAQVTAVEAALGRVDGPGLEQQAAQLERAARQAATAAMRTELSRSAAAVRDRQQVRARLLEARETLLARMQAVALGLEGLVARLAEVLALSATAGGTDNGADQIAELALELDGLRAGLAETEALSRRALAQESPDAPAGG